MISNTQRRGWTAIVASSAFAILVSSGVVVAQDPSGDMDYNHTYGRKGTTADLLPIDQFCGTEPVKVGIADGFGGNSWRKITRAEAEDEASKCANITEVLYLDGQNDPQKQISDLQSLVAQDFKVIIGFADAGAAMVPAYRDAFEAGVSIVPYIAPPVGGVVGQDLTDFVAEDVDGYGRSLAQWTIDAMGGKGNLVMLGGTPGNGYSDAVYQGVKAIAANYPEIKLLNADLGDAYVITNWEPGKTQEVVAGLLTQFDTIDGIVSDYGGGSVGGIRAFQAANRLIPPWSANDSNEFACLWTKRDAKETNYQIATISSRNWISRVALRRALANHWGIQNPEPQQIELPLSEDSLSADPALAPVCDETLPPDAILSSQLSPDQLRELFAQ